jgi:zinc protease
LLFTGSTNREDLLFQLQVFAAYLTDAAYRPEALEVARKNFAPLYQKLEHTPEGPLQLTVLRELASGDPRFGIPPRQDLFARTLDEEKAWLEPQLKKGAIEIAIVGDLDAQASIDAVGQTLGALPQREVKPPLTAERVVHYPAKPFDQHLTVVTQIPRGLLALFWATSDARDVHVQRRNTLLAQVFADRLRVEVRDKLGDAYSPYARNNSSEIFPGYGFFMSYLEVDPAKAQTVAGVVTKIADDLYKNGVTEEELSRAKQPFLTALRESARTNTYWLDAVLESAQENPQHLDWSRSRYKDFESIAKPEVDALAKTYFAPGKESKVIVTPTK